MQYVFGFQRNGSIFYKIPVIQKFFDFSEAYNIRTSLSRVGKYIKLKIP